MNEAAQQFLYWEVAGNADVVHALLEESDAEQARRYGLPAPRRNPATTAIRVAAGQVHLAWLGGHPAGSFTLTAEPPFELEPGTFPPAASPRYLSRLCVASGQLRDGLPIGLQCLRMAITVAARAGADVLRSQANPDVTGTLTMLTLNGFRQRGPITANGPLRVVNLQRELVAAS